MSPKRRFEYSEHRESNEEERMKICFFDCLLKNVREPVKDRYFDLTKHEECTRKVTIPLHCHS